MGEIKGQWPYRPVATTVLKDNMKSELWMRHFCLFLVSKRPPMTSDVLSKLVIELSDLNCLAGMPLWPLNATISRSSLGSLSSLYLRDHTLQQVKIDRPTFRNVGTPECHSSKRLFDKWAKKVSLVGYFFYWPCVRQVR